MVSFINENAIGAINVLDEGTEIKISDKVLEKMLALTIGKYNKIDFSQIEKSKGDVTKVKFYPNLNECINTLCEIHESTGQLPNALVLRTTLDNLVKNKSAFEVSFKVRNNCGIMIYNTITYALIEATSYVLASSIDFVKGDIDDEVDAVVINADTALIKNLVKFNKCVADGSMNKFISKNQEVATMHEGIADVVASTTNSVLPQVGEFLSNHKGVAIASAIVIGLLILGVGIIPLIRELVYQIYKLRHNISQAAELQAYFLECNIRVLKDKNDPNNDKVIAKQTKSMNMFRSIANKFALDTDKAERDAKAEIVHDKVDVSGIII
jgi:hypothetical protein